MGFSIFIKSDYVDVEVCYPYEGWDDDYEGWKDDEREVGYRQFMQRCIDVNPTDEREKEELWDYFLDPSNDCGSTVATAVSGSYASIEVDDEEIENPFRDDEKYDIPDEEDLIPELIKSKFCFLKVWENSGGFYYEDFEDDTQFDIAKLTWEKGEFLYDGKEFDFTDGKGHSSSTRFYKDGVCV